LKLSRSWTRIFDGKSDRLSNATGVPGACNQCSVAASRALLLLHGVCVCMELALTDGLRATPERRREAAQLL